MGNLDLNKNWRKFEPESTKLFFKVVIKAVLLIIKKPDIKTRKT